MREQLYLQHRESSHQCGTSAATSAVLPARACTVKFTVYDADVFGHEEIGSVEHTAESLSTGESI